MEIYGKLHYSTFSENLSIYAIKILCAIFVLVFKNTEHRKETALLQSTLQYVSNIYSIGNKILFILDDLGLSLL